MEVKGGEVHFPLIDVENNEKGIIIKRLNGADIESGDTSKQCYIYYNNVNEDPLKYNNSWSALAGGKNVSIIGEDSKEGGMKFHTSSSTDLTKWEKTGNQSVLDMWTYTNAKLDVRAEFIISDGSIPWIPLEPSMTVPPVVTPPGGDNPPGTTDNPSSDKPSTGNPPVVTNEPNQPLVNNPTSSVVSTGDSSQLVIYLGLGLACIVGVTLYIYMGKKK